MAVTADCPGKYHVALDGVGFMLDDSDGNPGITHQSIRTQREQQGGANASIGEVTVNPEGFWRRSRDGWHHGAGQTYGDRETSDPLRFRESDGVDVFGTRHQLSLLRSADLAHTFTSPYGYMKRVSTYMYLRDNLTVKYVAAPTTVPWTTTTVTTTGGNNGFEQNGLATDGSTIYIAYGSDGIFTTTPGAATATVFITGTSNEVFWAKGRLLSTNGPAIYNPVAGGALPAALLTLSSGFNWVDVAEGPNHIYMLAKNSSNTVVYKTQVQADGTALGVPTIAAELPSGEAGWAISGYVGKIFIGTSYGVRMASVDGDGNLVLGATIPAPLQAFQFTSFYGRNQYVWYGINTTGGLGRMDLTTETLPNTPAYAADVRPASETNQPVTAIESFDDQKMWIAAGKAYVESATTYVTTGYVTSGLLALDLADLKTPVSIDVEAATPSTTTIVEAVSVDRGATFTTVGTRNTANTDSELTVTGIAAARTFELKATLTGPGTATPTLYRHTLKVEPGVSQGNYIILRLRLFENEIGFGNQAISRASVAAARAQIEAWQAARTVIVLQEGSTNYNVTVRDVEWQSESAAQPTADGQFQGVITCRLKVISNA